MTVISGPLRPEHRGFQKRSGRRKKKSEKDKGRKKRVLAANEAFANSAIKQYCKAVPENNCRTVFLFAKALRQ